MDAIVSQFTTSFGMLTGNLPKARLFIRKKADQNGKQLNLNSVGAGVGGSDVSALRSLLKTRKKSAAKKMGNNATAASLGAATTQTKVNEKTLQAELSLKGFLSMDVQYNPNSIRMNTVAGAIETYEGIGDKGMNQITRANKNVSTYMTVTLIFEDIEVADAFGTQDNLGLNVEGIKSTVKSTVTNLVNSDGYTVRPQVEALISLLIYKRTRQVIFYWSEMFFHGELMEVNANYTMFNKKGHPIKAEVTLVIQQPDANDVFKSDVAYWDDAFDAVFGD